MKRFFKKIYNFIKKNMLLCLVVCACMLMWVYGLLLSKSGYMLTGESANESLIALAFTKVGEGIYPWNMNATKVDDYGYVETIELEGIAFNTVSEAAIPEEEEIDPEEEEDLQYEYLRGSEYTIGPVPESYFDDAVFIGDSRMEGVYEYAGLDNATFLTKVSMSIYTMMDSKVSNPDYKTVLDGLSDRQYGKVYMMVGINEIGTATTEYFVNHYMGVISQIRELQPDAIIVVQAIMHVTGSRDEVDEYFNNTNIDARNEGLKTLANGKDIFYIDVNPVYDDENGNLIEDYSSDNIHLYGNKYADWKEFFLENGIYKKGTDPFENVNANENNEEDVDDINADNDEETGDEINDENDD